MRLSIIALGLYAALVAASPVPEPEAEAVSVPNEPDWNDVFIESVSYGGTGCPKEDPESVTVVKAIDWKTVTFLFSKYTATIGPGSKPGDFRKNCAINLKIHYPKGYQYTMYQTDYTGFVSLDKKVKAYQQSDYWFAGFIQGKASFKSTWVGPFTDTYTFTDKLTSQACVWSPCGEVAMLNINTNIWLDNSGSGNPKGSGYIATDTIDHKVKNINHIQWRKC